MPGKTLAKRTNYVSVLILHGLIAAGGLPNSFFFLFFNFDL